MVRFKLLLLSLFLPFVVSCQTTEGVVISESTLSIKNSRIAIVAALGPARTISENGREYTSYYHDRKLKPIEIGPKTKERLYTKVTVLGARRPYEISVEVRIERRDPDTFSFLDVGIEERLSLSQAKQVRQALNQSLEKNRAIDDGLPF